MNNPHADGISPDLDELAIMYGTDKSSRAHGYTRHYQTHLAHLRAQPNVNIAEIGVHTGASIRMWAAWLPHAAITGIDTDLRQVMHPETLPANVQLKEVNAQDWQPAAQSYDLIIDDGSHRAADIAHSLVQHWWAIRPGGILAVEDWATQWQEVYGGSNAGSRATVTARLLLDRVLRADVLDPAELHAYPQLLILRAAP